MAANLERIRGGLRRRWVHHRSDRTTERLAAEVERHAPPASGAPVVFFNASTRLEGMSLNAGFALTAAWALRLQGVPVVHFVCRAGMTRCMLAAALNGPDQAPPCKQCAAKSSQLTAHADVHWFSFQPDEALDRALAGLDIPGLTAFEHGGLPLGRLVLPSVRWALRRFTLPEDEPTQGLFREFIRSAWRVAQEFGCLLDEVQPRSVVVFNGIAFPEAVARTVAQRRGLTVFTHEVGIAPFTAFFTAGDATAYPIEIPADFEFSPAQAARLDAYLEKRFQGNFSMAGVRFWPEMQSLSPAFAEKAAQFRQIVPVFTNVIFDTSQEHANVVFANMFAWLEQVLAIIRAHPDTLFVLRAHPDELRPGKASRESVGDWARRNRIAELPNVVFVDSNEYLSSYELIQRSKFVMVYNSTIGLEAAIMGAPVLCAGKARFTQVPTVFFPPTPETHRQQAEDFLAAETIDVPAAFRTNARKFLYFQLYRVSLPFQDVLEEDGVWRGFVRLNAKSWRAFLPGSSPTFRVIVDGILHQKPFVMPE
ncbi:MAG TPA: hypothetical protein VFF68_01700 [Anaerolineaceae bacterium]|nr:hypothetical protein [Anaerolineaceae bacterium]